MGNGPLEMVRGDSAEWDVEIFHPVTKQPLNLSGCTIKFAAKRKYSDLDADAIINISSPTEITITPPDSDGKAHIKVPAADTLDLDNVQTKLVYDLQVTKGSDRWTVDRDSLLVLPEVVAS